MPFSFQGKPATASIAGLTINPVGVSVIDFAIPAGVRRLTLLSSRLKVEGGVIVRFGTSSGVLTSGYYSLNHYIVASAAGLAQETEGGLLVPNCGYGPNSSFCMTFYRISPNDWNVTGQSKDGVYNANITSGNISLPGELTTFRYINPVPITVGSLQLLWEF